VPTTGALTQDDFRGAAEGQDQRKSPRYPSHRPIKYLPCKAAEEWGFRPARLVDASSQGIGMRTSEAMKANDQFLVKFRAEGVVMLLYTVRYCRPLDPPDYRIGAQLIGFIGSPHKDPNWLLDMLTAPSSDDTID
jgi:hypothetical protein